MFIIRILRALFGIYALLASVVNLLLFAPLAVIIFATFPGKAKLVYAHKMARAWAFMYQFFLFMPMRIRNRNYIDKKKTYVIVANHQSQLDIPLYLASCSNTFRFLAKAELTKIPLFGYVLKTMYITVNREERADRNKSIEVMKRSLDEGISVYLCPEGTRNKKKDPPLLDFRDGAFRLAIATQTPVAIFTLLNTGDKLSPLRAVELAPGPIYGIWDKPIETTGMTLDDVPVLRDRVRAIMIKHLEEFRKQ